MADTKAVRFLERLYTRTDRQIREVVTQMLPDVTFSAQDDGAVISNVRRILNFTGPGLTVTDNPALKRVDIFVPGGVISSTTVATYTFTSSARYLSLWNGSSNDSPPANWETVAFNDSGWSTPTLVADGSQYGSGVFISSPSSTAQVLFRYAFTLPAGSVASALLNYNFDSVNSGAAVWINGTSIAGGSAHDALGVSVPSITFIPGATNVIAFRVGNNSALNADMGVRFRLTLTGGGAVGQDYINIQDQKSAGTAGGGFSNAAWRTRTLNTIVTNTASLASLASNQITLPIGTYRLSARAAGFACDGHQTRWQNITDTATELTGTTNYSSNSTSGMSHSHVVGRFTITGSKAFELQHRCETTRNTDGFGRALNVTTEVYSVVELWKES